MVLVVPILINVIYVYEQTIGVALCLGPRSGESDPPKRDNPLV